jgi:hypothetical protein
MKSSGSFFSFDCNRNTGIFLVKRIILNESDSVR